MVNRGFTEIIPLSAKQIIWQLQTNCNSNRQQLRNSDRQTKICVGKRDEGITYRVLRRNNNSATLNQEARVAQITYRMLRYFGNE